MVTISDPIEELLASSGEGLIPTLKRLSILGARFEDVDWQRPFPTDFSLLRDLDSHYPKALATALSQHDMKLFEGLPTHDIFDPKHPCLEDLAAVWAKLCNDVKACLVAESGLGERFSIMIIVSCGHFKLP